MNAPKLSRERAKRLRQDQTPPEGILWSRLRSRRLGGYKFRRQHPIGPYIADFFCHDAQLIVEVDGATHGPRRAQDARRDAWFDQRGIRTLRVPATEVFRNLDGVLVTIKRVADERTAGGLSRPPSPGGKPADLSQRER
ncbi:MAG: DUF559 domain-containing protein [Planctomycetota bacterium]|nr:MAG: DUF559 domain-containing protein [Planctomycetota bacterium]